MRTRPPHSGWFHSGDGRRRSLVIVLATVAAIAVLTIVIAPPLLSPLVRHRIERALGSRFDADVQLGSLRIFIVPLRISGSELRVRLRGRNEQDPPFLAIRAFSASASPLALVTGRVGRVTLDGLAIYVPPRREDGEHSDVKGEADLKIGEVVSRDATLTIAPNEAGKIPLVFQIATLHLDSVSLDAPFRFDATVTNPKPPGEIAATGTFGPWQAEPRDTPLEGDYTFADADLSVFKGISGVLSSSGSFAGMLGRIDVQGSTHTPDFALDIAGHGMRLDTTFDATVDGTNGDTILNKVEATLGGSSFATQGRIVKTAAEEGRLISVQAVMRGVALEDVLRLALKAEPPPMQGALDLDADITIPPGDADVIRKLKLEGSFTIAKGRFTEAGVQQKVEELSQRGRGEPEAEPDQRLFSELKGTFAMADAAMRFDTLTFRVPGAGVTLAGTYALEAEQLDFEGTLRLDAPLSKTTTGFKSLLLKIVDPFFRKRETGTVLPIKVGGTVKKPEFGLDAVRALTPK